MLLIRFGQGEDLFRHKIHNIIEIVYRLNFAIGN